MRRFSLIGGALALALVVALPGEAEAQSGYKVVGNTTMSVSLTKQDACTLQVSALSFPAATTDANVTSTTTVTVNCGSGVAYQIGLDSGLHGPGTRRMQHVSQPNQYLSYHLYTDAANTRHWGDRGLTSTNTFDPTGGLGTGAPQTHTIFATALVNLTSAAGDYTDTVKVLIAL